MFRLSDLLIFISTNIFDGSSVKSQNRIGAYVQQTALQTIAMALDAERANVVIGSRNQKELDGTANEFRVNHQTNILAVAVAVT